MSNELIEVLHRASQIANQKFESTPIGTEVTPRQLQVLSAIDANVGASQTRIVEVTGVDRSTLADMVRRLHGRKLIERRRSKLDARAYILKLTLTGKQALAAGEPIIAAVEDDILAVLPELERATLLSLLSKLVEAHESAKRN